MPAGAHLPPAAAGATCRVRHPHRTAPAAPLRPTAPGTAGAGAGGGCAGLGRGGGGAREGVGERGCREGGECVCKEVLVCVGVHGLAELCVCLWSVHGCVESC